jgi:hypothetical protein
MFDYNGDQLYTVDGRLDFNLPRCLYWDKPEIVAPKPKQRVKRWRWVFKKEAVWEYVSSPMTVEEINDFCKQSEDELIGRILETEEEIWV